MKKNRTMFLTEEQVRELLEDFGEAGPEQEACAEKRNMRILKHYQFSMFALTGTHS